MARDPMDYKFYKVALDPRVCREPGCSTKAAFEVRNRSNAAIGIYCGRHAEAMCKRRD